MMKEALEYIVGLKGGYDIVTQKERTYLVDKNGEEQKEFMERYQKSLETSTLSSIVDYFRGDPDKVLAGDMQYIIRIRNIGYVDVLSQISGELERHNLLAVRANLPDGFPFDQYMDLETFNIMLQSRFLDTEDRAKLLALTGLYLPCAAVRFNQCCRYAIVILAHPEYKFAFRLFCLCKGAEWLQGYRIGHLHAGNRCHAALNCCLLTHAVIPIGFDAFVYYIAGQGKQLGSVFSVQKAAMTL